MKISEEGSDSTCFCHPRPAGSPHEPCCLWCIEGPPEGLPYFCETHRVGFDAPVSYSTVACPVVSWIGRVRGWLLRLVERRKRWVRQGK